MRPRKAVNAYNQPVVFSFLSSRFGRALRIAVGAGAGFALVLTMVVSAQGQTATPAQKQTAAAAKVEATHAGQGRILLVLPFENRTGQPSLDWIQEAAAALLNSRFKSAGFAPLDREDRLYALAHLGLPEDFEPTMATDIKVAETVDVNDIVVGRFSMQGNEMVAEAQLVNVPHLRMSEPLTTRGPLIDMIAIFDSLAWKLTKEIDPKFSVAEGTFVAAGADLRLDAFEQYIRGITAPLQSERMAHLEQAVKLSPGYSAAWMGLGREEYSLQEYDKAAQAFAKVDRSGTDGLAAGFYRGLSLLFTHDYAGAQEAFAGVARVLPLAEVLNNEGVAVSRAGKDGTSLFVQAVAADPNTALYHFNLALSLKRHGNTAAALSEMAACLKLHPGDSVAQDLLTQWKAPTGQPDRKAASAGSAPAGSSADSEPQERVVRTFNAAAFRQAAAVLNQMEAARVAGLPAPERAKKLCAQAEDYLNRGLVLEAERLYQSALRADPKIAAAHAGLAEVRLRTGDTVSARKQAHEALQLDPSAEAYLVLSRLDLAAGHLTRAGNEAGAALKLDPANQAAQQLRRQIVAKQVKKAE